MLADCLLPSTLDGSDGNLRKDFTDTPYDVGGGVRKGSREKEKRGGERLRGGEMGEERGGRGREKKGKGKEETESGGVHILLVGINFINYV